MASSSRDGASSHDAQAETDEEATQVSGRDAQRLAGIARQADAAAHQLAASQAAAASRTEHAMSADEKKRRRAERAREVYAQKVQKQEEEQDAREAAAAQAEAAAAQAAADAHAEELRQFREQMKVMRAAEELEACQQGYESREQMLAAKRERERKREREEKRRREEEEGRRLQQEAREQGFESWEEMCEHRMWQQVGREMGYESECVPPPVPMPAVAMEPPPGYLDNEDPPSDYDPDDPWGPPDAAYSDVDASPPRAEPSYSVSMSLWSFRAGRGIRVRLRVLEDRYAEYHYSACTHGWPLTLTRVAWDFVAGTCLIRICRGTMTAFWTQRGIPLIISISPTATAVTTRSQLSVTSRCMNTSRLHRGVTTSATARSLETQPGTKHSVRTVALGMSRSPANHWRPSAFLSSASGHIPLRVRGGRTATDVVSAARRTSWHGGWVSVRPLQSTGQLVQVKKCFGHTNHGIKSSAHWLASSRPDACGAC